MGCIHADGGSPNFTCNRCEADERRAATVVVDPSIRLKLLRACGWLADRVDEEREAADAGAVNIRTKRKTIAGAYPIAVPLFILLDDLQVPKAHLLLAANELTKLGHLEGNPDVPHVIAHSVRITAAGRQWLRDHDQ